MTDQTLQAGSVNKNAPPLGKGPIGPVTEVHVLQCNAWLKPLAVADGFGILAGLTSVDIEGLLALGGVPSAAFDPIRVREADSVRQMLLVDMANVRRVIRWGMAPQDEEPTTELRVRLTARGRRMLQQCCPDLWDQMLYGRKK